MFKLNLTKCTTAELRYIYTMFRRLHDALMKNQHPTYATEACPLCPYCHICELLRETYLSAKKELHEREVN